MTLPPEYPTELGDEVRAAVAASGRKVVALDDDPTGVQTVANTPVLARWEVADLAAELRDPWPVCFVLTNSRSLPEAEAVRLNQTIATNLVAASRQTGADFVIASRSDSTLRGHFPAETDAVASILGQVDGVLLVPAFFEGGRLTIDDIHYVREGERLIPAAETEFARDATFGYQHSNLRQWVEEKSGGRIPAASVATISLADIRESGPDRVADQLTAIGEGRVVVINAAAYRDLDVVALGVLRAEAAGKRFVYRTGASFVRARAGLRERPLLTRAELLGPEAPLLLPGLVVVGSHVRRTSEQLAYLLARPAVTGVEVTVARLLDPDTRVGELHAAGAAVAAALGRGETPVIFTSRQLAMAPDPGTQLEISRSVSTALVDLVTSLSTLDVAVQPGWMIGKGGITSSDVGTKALGARRSVVLGQVRPGVPVWRLGPETRYPGLPYVIFPGNVGGPETLADVVGLLHGNVPATPGR